MSAVEHKPRTLAWFIDTFTDGERPSRTEGVTLRTGFTLLDSYALLNALPEGFSMVEAWCDEPFRMCWANHADRALITYCEGDITVDVAPDEIVWCRLLARCAEFYANH